MQMIRSVLTLLLLGACGAPEASGLDACENTFELGAGDRKGFAQWDFHCPLQYKSADMVIAPRFYIASQPELNPVSPEEDGLKMHTSFSIFSLMRSMGSDMSISSGLLQINPFIEMDFTCSGPLGCNRHLDRVFAVMDDGRAVATPAVSMQKSTEGVMLQAYIVGHARPLTLRNEGLAPPLPDGLTYGAAVHEGNVGGGARMSSEHDWGRVSASIYSGPSNAPNHVRINGTQVQPVFLSEDVVQISGEYYRDHYTMRGNISHRDRDGGTHANAVNAEIERIITHGNGDTTFLELGISSVHGSCDPVVDLQCIYRDGALQLRSERTWYGGIDFTLGVTEIRSDDSHYAAAEARIGIDDTEVSLSVYYANGSKGTFFGTYADTGISVTFTMTF